MSVFEIKTLSDTKSENVRDNVGNLNNKHHHFQTQTQSESTHVAGCMDCIGCVSNLISGCNEGGWKLNFE